MLYKKFVVIWANDLDILQDAAEDAVNAAREQPDVQAYGIHQEDHSVADPEQDEHYTPSVAEVLGDGFTFEDISVISADGKVKLVLEWIGEGRSGDYDPTDEDDEPLLRFSVFRKYQPGEEMTPHFLDDESPVEAGGSPWRSVADGSYCTQICARGDRAELTQKANLLLSQVEGDISNQQRCKRVMESLSWLE